MKRRQRLFTKLLLLALLAVIGAWPQGDVAAQTVVRLDKRLIDGQWQANQAIARSPRPISDRRPSTTPSIYSGDPEDWTRLVFSSFRGGRWDIYRFHHQDNSFTAINLTGATRGEDTYPRLNRSADQVVFATTRDNNWNIYAMNADGSGQAAQTADPANDVMPSWSPDGKTIAWVRAGETTGAIWLMNADGSNQRSITGQMPYLQHPNWSPDGARLAFDYDRNGDGFGDLGIINPDGSGLQAVTVLGNDAGESYRSDFTISGWSPEGDRLLVSAITYYLPNLSIYNMFISRVPVGGGQIVPLVFPENDMMADMRSLDLEPPQTTISSLPAYSRAFPTRIQWSGQDTGGSDFRSYDVQYRIGTGAWVDWQSQTIDTSAVFAATAGTTVTFRVRGRDLASNLEEWRTVSPGATSTTFFTWNLSGHVTDSRNMPIPEPTINITPTPLAPAAADAAGEYQVRLKTTGAHTIALNSPGYQAPPNTSLSITEDQSFSPYLPPLDDRLQNGGFEGSATQLTGWARAGTLPAAVSTTSFQTGSRSALLGQACPAPCLTNPELVPADRSGPSPMPASIVVDATNTVHVVWTRFDTDIFPDTRVYYQTRPPNGPWSTATVISIGRSPQLAIDGKQRLHIVWETPNNRLTYRQKPAAGGAWSASQDLGLANDAKLYADQQGQVYVTYYCFSILGCPNTGEGQYRIRTAAGIWQPARTIPTSPVTMAIGPDGTAYILWHGDNHGYLAKVQPDGSLGTPAQFGGDLQVYLPQGVLDANGVLHIVWALNQSMYYVARTPDGYESQPVLLPKGGGALFQLVGANGVLYLLSGTGDPLDDNIYLRTKPAAGAWSAPASVSTNVYPALNLAADISGRVHILRDNLYYQTTKSANAGSASIAQTINILANMHKPTLAFDYSLNGITATNGSRLDVVVTQGISSQTVFSATSEIGWQHGWVDMQPWTGKTVTISLVLQQASGVPNAQVGIDAVSLGSWLTPVVQSISPSVIEKPANTVITIAGTNFIATPKIYLGQLQLTGVQRIDEQTLKATLPSGLRPGPYRLTIVNPGGQRNALATLWIGRQAYLPIAQR